MRSSWTYFSFEWTDSAILADCYFLIRESPDGIRLVALEGVMPDGRQFSLVAGKEGQVQAFPDSASASVYLTKQVFRINAAGSLGGLDLNEWLEDPGEPGGMSITDISWEIKRMEELYPMVRSF